MIGRPLRPSTVTSSRVSFASRNSVPASVLAGSRWRPALGVSDDSTIGVATLRRLPAALNWVGEIRFHDRRRHLAPLARGDELVGDDLLHRAEDRELPALVPLPQPVARPLAPRLAAQAERDRGG